MTEVETRCAGIPCIARVTHYSYESQYDVNWVGYEVEFELLDRRGRPAPWLEAKRTAKVDEKIIDDIISYMGG